MKPKWHRIGGWYIRLDQVQRVPDGISAFCHDGEELVFTCQMMDGSETSIYLPKAKAKREYLRLLKALGIKGKPCLGWYNP